MNVREVDRIKESWDHWNDSYPFGFFQSPYNFDFYYARRDRLKYQLNLLAVIDDKERVCGVLPVFRTRFSKKLIFLNGGTAEMVLDKARETEILATLRDYFQKTGMYIHASYIHEGSSLHRLYELCDWEVESWDRMHWIDLSGGYEAYLERRSGKHIKNFRSDEKKIHELGSCELVFENSPERFDAAFDQLIALNHERWGHEVTSLNTPKLVDYVKKFAAYQLKHGKLFLSFFNINGKPESVYFGVRDRESVYYLQSGWNPAYEKYGLGKIHLFEILRWCCEHQIRYFNFLYYTTEYKNRVCTDSIVVYRNASR